MSHNLLEVLSKFLESASCGVCHNPFTSSGEARSSRNLQCSHTFCLECVSGLLSSFPAHCPTCQVSGFPQLVVRPGMDFHRHFPPLISRPNRAQAKIHVTSPDALPRVAALEIIAERAIAIASSESPAFAALFGTDGKPALIACDILRSLAAKSADGPPERGTSLDSVSTDVGPPSNESVLALHRLSSRNSSVESTSVNKSNLDVACDPSESLAELAAAEEGSLPGAASGEDERSAASSSLLENLAAAAAAAGSSSSDSSNSNEIASFASAPRVIASTDGSPSSLGGGGSDEPSKPPSTADSVAPPSSCSCSVDDVASDASSDSVTATAAAPAVVSAGRSQPGSSRSDETATAIPAAAIAAGASVPASVESGTNTSVAASLPLPSGAVLPGGAARIPSTIEILRKQPLLAAAAAHAAAPPSTLQAMANMIRFVLTFCRKERRLVSDVGTILHKKGLWPVDGIAALQSFSTTPAAAAAMAAAASGSFPAYGEPPLRRALALYGSPWLVSMEDERHQWIAALDAAQRPVIVAPPSPSIGPAAVPLGSPSAALSSPHMSTGATAAAGAAAVRPGGGFKVDNASSYPPNSAGVSNAPVWISVNTAASNAAAAAALGGSIVTPTPRPAVTTPAGAAAVHDNSGAHGSSSASGGGGGELVGQSAVTHGISTFLRKLLSDGPVQMPSVGSRLREARLWPLSPPHQHTLKSWMMDNAAHVAHFETDTGPGGGKREWLVLNAHSSSYGTTAPASSASTAGVSPAAVLGTGSDAGGGLSSSSSSKQRTVVIKAAAGGGGGGAPSLASGSPLASVGSSSSAGFISSTGFVPGGSSGSALPSPMSTATATGASERGGRGAAAAASPASTALPLNHPTSILRALAELVSSSPHGAAMPRVGVTLRRGGHWPPLGTPAGSPQAGLKMLDWIRDNGSGIITVESGSQSDKGDHCLRRGPHLASFLAATSTLGGPSTASSSSSSSGSSIVGGRDGATEGPHSKVTARSKAHQSSLLGGSGGAIDASGPAPRASTVASQLKHSKQQQQQHGSVDSSDELASLPVPARGVCKWFYFHGTCTKSHACPYKHVAPPDRAGAAAAGAHHAPSSSASSSASESADSSSSIGGGGGGGGAVFPANRSSVVIDATVRTMAPEPTKAAEQYKRQQQEVAQYAAMNGSAASSRGKATPSAAATAPASPPKPNSSSSSTSSGGGKEAYNNPFSDASSSSSASVVSASSESAPSPYNTSMSAPAVISTSLLTAGGSAGGGSVKGGGAGGTGWAAITKGGAYAHIPLGGARKQLQPAPLLGAGYGSDGVEDSYGVGGGGGDAAGAAANAAASSVHNEEPVATFVDGNALARSIQMQQLQRGSSMGASQPPPQSQQQANQGQGQQQQQGSWGYEFMLNQQSTSMSYHQPPQSHQQLQQQQSLQQQQQPLLFQQQQAQLQQQQNQLQQLQAQIQLQQQQQHALLTASASSSAGFNNLLQQSSSGGGASGGGYGYAANGMTGALNQFNKNNASAATAGPSAAGMNMNLGMSSGVPSLNAFSQSLRDAITAASPATPPGLTPSLPPGFGGNFGMLQLQRFSSAPGGGGQAKLPPLHQGIGAQAYETMLPQQPQQQAPLAAAAQPPPQQQQQQQPSLEALINSFEATYRLHGGAASR